MSYVPWSSTAVQFTMHDKQQYKLNCLQVFLLWFQTHCSIYHTVAMPRVHNLHLKPAIVACWVAEH